MKKFVSLLIAICMLSVSVMADIGIEINGQAAEISADMGTIIARDNRVFVPVRFVLENLNYNVQWMSEDSQIMGTSSRGDFFMMQIGSPDLFFKGAEDETIGKTEMDVTPFVDYEAGRVYVPVRFLCETIGYEVEYDGGTQTVLLTKRTAESE